MADQSSVSLPEIKPGTLVWIGRFRNRPGIIDRVWSENGKPKYEVIPIPQGRKHPKVRNLLPFKPMTEEDSAKYRKMYDDEQTKKREKSAKVAERYLEVCDTEFDDPAGVTVWASENGMYRIQDMGIGPQRFQSLHRSGSVWCEDMGWPSLKAALRDLRRIGGIQ